MCYVEWSHAESPSMRSSLYYPDSSKRVCMFSSHRMPGGIYRSRSVVVPFQSSIEELATQQLQRNEMDGIIPPQSNAPLNTTKNVRKPPRTEI